MKKLPEVLGRLALGLFAALALGGSCTAFAAGAAGAGEFRVEQAYVNAPDSRIYFYALQGDGTSYSADMVGLAGLQLKLNDDALTLGTVSAAGDDPVTYIYVLDTTVDEDQFKLMRRAILQQRLHMGDDDQLMIYTAAESVNLLAAPGASYNSLRRLLDGVKLQDGSSNLSEAVTRAGSYVSDKFNKLNPRKVLFLMAEDPDIVTDKGMMAALKNTRLLGALGFSIYGFSFGSNNIAAVTTNMLQWMCDYEPSLLVGVDTDSFMDAYNSRLAELKKVLVATAVVDKGLVDGTEKTMTLLVNSLGVSSGGEVLMTHELESPSIREVRCVDQNHVRVMFNEAVNGAGSTRAYLFKDGMGRRMNITEVTMDADENSALLTVSRLYDGDYTIALRSGRVTDKSSAANKCSTEGVSLSVSGGYPRDFWYYWGLVRSVVVFLLAAAALYTLLWWNDRRKDRREETVAQAEAYLSGEEGAVLAGNDPEDGDPHSQDASLPLNELQSQVATLFITVNRNVTNRMEVSIVSSYLIGSAAGQCDLRIEDAQVSGQHCIISVEKNGLAVQDLESRYGTFVNGKRIHEPTRLDSGALLTVGRTKIRIKYSRAAAGLKTEVEA